MLDCLVDGEILGFIPADDRGLAYGDGLFETIPVLRGQPRWWQDHMDRISAGCQRLGIGMPDQAVLLREVQTVCAGHRQCVAKIILTRGSGGRGYLAGSSAPARRIVSAHIWPAQPEWAMAGGGQAHICELRLGLQPALGGMKHLNRLEQVLAAAEAQSSGADEGVLLDHDAYVISAISGNIFLASGQRLLTPRLDRCGVRGVLRGRILKVFKGRCELRRITLDMLAEADEAFVCNAIKGILPLQSIGDYKFRVGPVALELQGWLAGEST